MLKIIGNIVGAVLLGAVGFFASLVLIKHFESDPTVAPLHLKGEPTWLIAISVDGEPDGMYIITEGVPIWVPVEAGTPDDVKLVQKHVEENRWSNHNIRTACEAMVTHE